MQLVTKARAKFYQKSFAIWATRTLLELTSLLLPEDIFAADGVVTLEDDVHPASHDHVPSRHRTKLFRREKASQVLGAPVVALLIVNVVAVNEKLVFWNLQLFLCVSFFDGETTKDVNLLFCGMSKNKRGFLFLCSPKSSFPTQKTKNFRDKGRDKKPRKEE